MNDMKLSIHMRVSCKLLLFVYGLSMFHVVRASGTLHFQPPSVRTLDHGMCNIQSCNLCSSNCLPQSELLNNLNRCNKLAAVASKANASSNYVTCVTEPCVELNYQQACGLLRVDPSKDIIAQLDEAIKKKKSETAAMMEKKRKYVNERVKDEAMVPYYEKSLVKTAECKALFREALKNRAYYHKMSKYIQSLDYRRMIQEVTRLRFENEDLYRHLKFWKQQNETLFLAVRTSPRGLKDARDALRAEMLTYQADSTLISILRNSSLTKEDHVRLVVFLKEKVRHEIESIRDHKAHVRTEAAFIMEARREVYYLLRTIYSKMKMNRIDVKCGGDILGEMVSSTMLGNK